MLNTNINNKPQKKHSSIPSSVLSTFLPTHPTLILTCYSIKAPTEPLKPDLNHDDHHQAKDISFRDKNRVKVILLQSRGSDTHFQDRKNCFLRQIAERETQSVPVFNKDLNVYHKINEKKTSNEI